MFLVEVMLDGNPVPFPLCRCLSVQSVAAIVTALCAARETRPIVIRRDLAWPDPVAVAEPAALEEVT